MDTSHDKSVNIFLATSITVIFIYLYYCNYIVDLKNKLELEKTPCYKDRNTNPSISDTERDKIEYVVHDYISKSKKNKSNCLKIKNGVVSGVIRGLMGGVILGGGVTGSLKTAAVFGIIGGTMSAYKMKAAKKKYLCNHKHTV